MRPRRLSARFELTGLTLQDAALLIVLLACSGVPCGWVGADPVRGGRDAYHGRGGRD